MNQVAIADYRPSWPSDFNDIATVLRGTFGDTALLIHHIGSTAVSGLGAKDIIDIQITVADIDDPAIEAAAVRAGAKLTGITDDHPPPGSNLDPSELKKQFFELLPPHRRANIHVRQAGRFNQEYALLCRDYLRAHPEAALAYDHFKRNLARRFAEDPAGYYEVKDPVFDIMMAAAREWQENTGWQPPPSDA